jgi:hypothetical protein
MLLAQAKSYLHILRKQNISHLPVGKYFTRRRRISSVPKERISLKTPKAFSLHPRLRAEDGTGISPTANILRLAAYKRA